MIGDLIDSFLDIVLPLGGALIGLAGLLLLAIICAGLWRMFVWVLV